MTLSLSVGNVERERGGRCVIETKPHTRVMFGNKKNKKNKRPLGGNPDRSRSTSCKIEETREENRMLVGWIL